MKNFWNWFLDNQHTFKNLMNETTEKQLHNILDKAKPQLLLQGSGLCNCLS